MKRAKSNPPTSGKLAEEKAAKIIENAEAEAARIMQKAKTDECKNGVLFKVSPNFESGFRIGMKDGGVHYDFTNSGIAEMLTHYLHSTLAELIKHMSHD